MVSVREIFSGNFKIVSISILGAFFLIKQLFHPPRVGYEMIMAIRTQRASLAIYHVLFNVRSWIDVLKYTMRRLTERPSDLFE